MATEVIPTENGKKEVGADKSMTGTDVPMLESIQNSDSDMKDGEGNDVVTPNGRPVRERKTVDRYSLSSSDTRTSTPKTLSIAKGSGTPLKDIPNVAFKLSKRKPDDTLQHLHMILFGKRAKAQNLKKDIGLFSGFVWEENEEKQRARMKERLDKYVKDKLVDFCDVLNIMNVKSLKKEDILVKLLEFLESPHATTEVLLADKEKKKSKKKKGSAKSSSSKSKSASGEKSAKKTSGEKRKRSSADEESETDNTDDKMSSQSHSSGEEDNASPKQDSDQKQISSDEEKDEVKEEKTSPKNSSKDNSEAKSGEKSVDLKKRSNVKSSKSLSKSAKKTKDAPKNSISEKSSSVSEPSDSPSKGRVSSSKKRHKVDEGTKHKKFVSTDKYTSKKASKSTKSTKSLGGEEETKEGDKVEPTKKELHAIAINILKEVDFNTATLSDILRLLGSHFGVDLTHRKKEVKAVIQEVIESMSGAEEGEDEDNEEENAEDDEDSGEE